MSGGSDHLGSVVVLDNSDQAASDAAVSSVMPGARSQANPPASSRFTALTAPSLSAGCELCESDPASTASRNAPQASTSSEVLVMCGSISTALSVGAMTAAALRRSQVILAGSQAITMSVISSQDR